MKASGGRCNWTPFSGIYCLVTVHIPKTGFDIRGSGASPIFQGVRKVAIALNFTRYLFIFGLSKSWSTVASSSPKLSIEPSRIIFPVSGKHGRHHFLKLPGLPPDLLCFFFPVSFAGITLESSRTRVSPFSKWSRILKRTHARFFVPLSSILMHPVVQQEIGL